MAKAATASKTAPQEIGGFKVKRVVTLPVWKWEDGVQKIFRIETPIVESKQQNASKDENGKPIKGKIEMAPAHVATVVNVETGEMATLIFGAVLKGNLLEQYPNASYVGKIFASVQSKIAGKRYKGYTLTELEA